MDWSDLMDEREQRCRSGHLSPGVTGIVEGVLKHFVENVLFAGSITPRAQREKYKSNAGGGFYGKSGSSTQKKHIINPWERMGGDAIKDEIEGDRGGASLARGPGFLESLAFHAQPGAGEWTGTVTTDAKMTPYAVSGDTATRPTPYYLRKGWEGVSAEGHNIKMQPRWPNGTSEFLHDMGAVTYYPIARAIAQYIINGKP